jgi:hypothetical protein
MNFSGLLIGLGAFFIIGALHPVVIKVEYHWGKRCWPLFLAGALFCAALSLWISHFVASTLLGVLCFSLLWTIVELFEQEKRVEKGWFPANPKRIEKR